MNEPAVRPGDTVRVTVTKVLPCAVLVETATDIPGLFKQVGLPDPAELSPWPVVHAGHRRRRAC